MKRIFLAVLLFGLMFSAFAQNVLILENMSIGKSYKFFPGDVITVLTKNNPKKVSGKITEIQDSAIVISNNYVYSLDEIKVVYKERIGVRIISALLMRFGIVFFTVDAVNNAIHDDHPTFRPNVAIISAASLGAGTVLWFFRKRKCIIAKNWWRLKILQQVHIKTK